MIERLRRWRERRRVDRELTELARYAPYTPALAGEAATPARVSGRPALAQKVAIAAVVSVFALAPYAGMSLWLGSALADRQAEAQAEASLDAARETYTAAVEADYEARGEKLPDPGRLVSGAAEIEPTTEAAAEAREEVVAAEARLEALEDDPNPLTITLDQVLTGEGL